MRPAPEPIAIPGDVDRFFFAALARAAHRQGESGEAIVAARKKARDDEAARWQRRVDTEKEVNRRLRNSIEEFEKAAGFSILQLSWPNNPATIGAAMRLLLDADHIRMRLNDAKRPASALEEAATSARDGVDALEEFVRAATAGAEEAA